MRIIYFHQHFSTPSGATGTRSYEMARRLISQGHEVIMVCGSHKNATTGLTGPFVRGCRRGRIDDIEVVELDLSFGNTDGFMKRSQIFAQFAFASVGLALREDYDLVFATSTPLTAGIPGIFARWLRGKPFIFEVRDLWPELPRAMGVIRNPVILGLMAILEWLSCRSARRCIGLSPGIAEGIAKTGVDPAQVAMVPNGCDIELFRDPTAKPWRPDGIKHDAFLAIFTGTHGLANGLDAVIDAAAVLEQRGRSDIRILLVGNGKMKPDLQARAASLGLQNVIFHPSVAKVELVGLMAAADIGIQCLKNVPAFYFGTSPNKFFDYIAAGLPVLNNYPGWLAGLITEHDCGFAVAPDDPEAFADALEVAADDRLALARKATNAGQLAETEFDRGKLADAWVDWVVNAPSVKG
jgi:glycosyltransferase involved in cell wall biosynthesis